VKEDSAKCAEERLIYKMGEEIRRRSPTDVPLRGIQKEREKREKINTGNPGREWESDLFFFLPPSFCIPTLQLVHLVSGTE
jgi:hypothetical protein